MQQDYEWRYCLGLHSEGTINANGFPVQQRVVNDGLDELSILGRLSEALWERHSLRQEIADLLRQRQQHGSLEQAWRDGDHTNSLSREIPGDWKSHANHCGFGCRICSLSNLTVIGSDRGCIDDNSPLAVLVRFVLANQSHRETNDIESSNSVDVDDSLEVL